MSTINTRIRSYYSQKENESLNSLEQIDTLPAPADLALKVGDKIDPSLGPRIRIKGDPGAVTLSATPQILPASAPQKLTLEGADAGAIVTIQAEAVNAGSGVKLPGGANIALGEGHILELFYSPEDGSWLALSPVADNS